MSQQKSEKLLIKGSKRSPSPLQFQKPKSKLQTEKTQSDFHENCMRSNPRKKQKKQVQASIVYRPSHRGRSADLTRKINNLPGERSERTFLKKKMKGNDKRGYTQLGWKLSLN